MSDPRLSVASEGKPALRAVPMLDELARDPVRAEALPPDVRRTLVLRAAAVIAALAAADVGETGRVPASEPDHLVLIEEAASILATSPDTLYTKWRRLPFAFKDPLDGKIKFTLSGVKRYIAGRTTRSTS